MAVKERVLIVAVGGATCSGKTTLAKLLRTVIGEAATILHQDDFAPPADQLPIHPVYGVQDWDDPPGAIIWEKQRKAIKHLRATGELPEGHSSHDHLNDQIPVPVSEELLERWKQKFAALREAQNEERVRIVLADGFLIFYDAETVKEFDVRIFVREDYALLKDRREKRQTYFTAEGDMWKDPPDYWDQVVWPAYLKAHRPLFIDGDVENGQPDESKIERLTVFDAGHQSMDSVLERACQQIYDGLLEKV